MTRLFLLGFFLLILGAPLGGARADAVAVTAHTRVELLADGPPLPGKPLTLALRLTPAKGWHTYWRNPGDTGLATSVEWHLPPGVEAGPLQYPAPEVIPVGPFANYGYTGPAWLLADLTFAPQAPPAGIVGATADWLVCSDVCVPESAELSLNLADAAGPAPAPGFAAARAKLPKAAPVVPRAWRAGEAAVLDLAGLPLDGPAHFFPDEGGVVVAAGEQRLDGRSLSVPLDPSFKGGDLRGVLVAGAAAWDMAAPMGAAPAASGAGTGFWVALGLAVLGGLILNVMPCVLPVLSIKALRLMAHPAGARADGAAYFLGVMASFLALAGLLLVLRAAGLAVGWGFQLQDPVVVGLLALLFFLVGLNLLGFLDIGPATAGLGEGLTRGRGGSFFTGVLAVVAASPCTAPFMGVALGSALVRPPVEALAIFAGLGLGFGLPFLVLSLLPALGRRLPRPGTWMVRLRQVLAFPMFASAAWMVWVAGVAGGDGATALLLAALVLAGFAVWGRSLDSRAGRLVFVLALAGSIVLAALSQQGEDAGKTRATEGQAYGESALVQARAKGPVFVNATAAWCITCLVNERTTLDRPSVRAALAAKGVTYMVADWTRQDAEIGALLARHGRAGVPLYLLFPKGEGPPQVLPQILTEGIVEDALGRL